MPEFEALTDEELTKAAERVVRNQLTIQELQEENDRIKSYWKQDAQAFPAGKTIDLGKYFVRISENKRIDNTLAKEFLSESQFDAYSKKVIDPALVKRNLPGQMLEKMTKKFDNKVEIGLR